jgi:hypothetical protein
MVLQLSVSALGEGKSMYYKHGSQTEDSITIRHARPGDEDGLRRLAERDSAHRPEGQVLVALIGDELRAAIPVGGGDAIADPFHPTAELLRLLTARAEQLRPKAGDRGGWFRRLHIARRRRGLAPQPVGTLRASE